MKNRFRTYDLAVAFYHSSQRLKLKSALREQLNRAAASIALNLAEGRGKPTVKDQIRFFHIAMGSVRECQAIFELAALTAHSTYQELDLLAASLYCLIRSAS
jgi:four helix bundle protein